MKGIRDWIRERWQRSMLQRALLVAPPVALLLLAGFLTYGTRPRVEYYTRAVDRGNIEQVVQATGTINAVTTVQVGSQVSGKIAEIRVDFNSRVKKGDVIAQIDPATFRTRLVQAEADLEELCLPHFEPPRALGQGDLVAIPFRPMTSRGALAAVSPMVLEMFGYPLLTGWETWAELSPETAREMDLADGDRVSLEAAGGGAVEAVIRVRPGGADGVVHLPLGLGHRDLGGAAAGIGSNPLDVLAGARDPLSGALSPAPTRVEVRLIERRRHGAPVPLEGGPA